LYEDYKIGSGDILEKKLTFGGDYIVIKAIEDGVNVIGLTRGTDTRFHH
jgi:transcription attenuation protein (tryptophan RNA-binding attenuator protein)